MAKILVIDDDVDILKLIEQALRTQHEVTTQDTPLSLTKSDWSQYDLILLDVRMPEIDGFRLLRQNRMWIDAPVLFLTAKDFEEDKVEGFASGGDDYITKPFSIKELRARVAAHLRREKREKHARLVDGIVTCDMVTRSFYVHEKEIPLTPSEYDICLLLMKRRGQVYAKEDIYTSIYGYFATGDSQTTITERIKQIRRKFKSAGMNPIETVWGIGYKWEISH